MENNLAVYDRMDLQKHGAVMASAGTGKTYTVQNLILRLLMQKTANQPRYQLSEILIVTYTEKATGELKDRVRAHLNKALDGLRNNSYPKNSLGEIYSSVDDDLLDIRELKEHLEKQILNFDQARIFTIHSFCQRILKENAINTALPMKLELSDGVDLSKRIVRDWWNSYEWEDTEFETLMGSVKPDQFLAELSKILLQVDSEEKLILEYVDDSDDSDENSLLTPTELETRYNDFKNQFDQLTMKVESLDNELTPLRALEIEYANHLNEITYKNELSDLLEKAASIAKKDISEQLNHLNIFLKEGVYKGTKNSKTKTVEIMKSLSELNKLFTLKEFNNLGKKFEKEVASSECWNSFSDLVIQYLTLSAEIKECNRLIKTHKESIADFARKMMNCFLYRILALPNGLIPKFQHELKSKGLLTFDGMIKHTAQALQESSQKKELICSLQETYKYGVIDEFQDTTHEQWEIFKTIFLDDKNVDRNVLVVGDPKQSIYSFQGAEIKTCLDAVEEIEEMNLKISNFKLGEQRTKESIETSADKEKYLGRYELDTNYRSSEKLIRGYDELFTNDKWFGGESKTTGLNEKYSGVMAGETPKDITDNNTPAMSILDFSEYTDSNKKQFKPNVKKSIVTKWAVAQIVKLLEQGVDPSEIAILGQRRSEYKEIVLKLKDLKIPVSLTKEEGLFQGELALELLICLEGIIYQDTASKHKAFLTRFFGLEPQDMIGVSDEIGETIYGAHYNKSQSNIERLKGIAKVGKWGILFRKLWDDFQQDEISYSLDRAAYRQIVSYILKSIYDKGMTLEVVTRQLRSLYKGDLKESKEENSYQRETSSAAIQAMTLHASKGLEFPYVLIPSGLSTHFKGMTSNFLTMISEGRGQKYYLDTAAVEKKKKLDELEWMRLFYVGYTRPEKWIGFPWYCISGTSKTPAVQFLDASIKGSSKAYVELVNPGDVLAVTNNSQINISVKKASNELQGDKSIEIPQGPQRLRDTESFNNKNPRPSDRTSVQTSFTSLSKIKGFDEPDLPDSTLLTLNTNVQNELWNPLTKNASTGLLIHEVLEKTDFRIFHPELYTTTETQNEFNLMTWRENILIPKLKQHQPSLLNNKDKESQQTSLDSMQTIFYQILNTDLQLQGLVLPQESASFKLSQLAPMDAVVRMMVETHTFEIGTYHAEPEFWFPYDKDGNTNWDSKTDQVKAWVLGFIDLLFEIQGNYYILDWKTNTLSDYSDKFIAKSMKEHKYHWQAALYSKAVSEWLKGFDPDAVSHKVAGAVYFYVRGCGDQGSMPLWQNTVEGLIRDFEAGVQPAMKELVQTKPNQSNILNSEDLIDV